MKDYNFFEIYEKKKGISINPKSITFVGLVLLILFIMISAGFAGRNLYISYKIDKLTANTETLKASREYIEAQKIQTSVDALKEYDSFAEVALKKFQNGNTLGTETLTTISSAIPTNVSLNSMTLSHDIALFFYNVPDRIAAAELVANLQALDIFHDVHLVKVELDSGGIQQVAQIECIMKAGEEIE